MTGKTYLKLDLGLSNVLIATAAVGNLLSLGDLRPHGLLHQTQLAICSTLCVAHGTWYEYSHRRRSPLEGRPQQR